MPADVVRQALRDVVIIGVATAAIAVVRANIRSGVDASAPSHLEITATVPRPPLPDPSVLRVCADPNNLPFSNEKHEGFENKIAELVATDLGKHVEYYWQPQRRGFIRTTLNARWCDLVVGVPARFDLALTTRPYYRSTYVFVSKRDRKPRVRSLDDPALRRLRIGVEMTGEDYDNPPALQALASRHIIDNVRGYLVYGDYSKPDPPRQVIDAVANGEVDTAIAWGPLAGYFAARSATPLEVDAVTPQRDGAVLTFAFEIAMAVRRHDEPLRDALNGAIARHASGIRNILVSFGVPLLPLGAES